ncbi:MAG: fibronectin type III domain-containing protein [Acidobacteria bacterium]|nr:fibronectin type III domain-containing protein [Acidobacteriota bacterium]MCI0720391.1 fibronectin type III domain-containing protein [Acidobacteriota bacterium]
MTARMRPHLIRFLLTLLLSVGALTHAVFAGSLLVSWDPVPDSRVAGYKVKYGTASKSYTGSVDAGPNSSQVLQSLTEGTTYYFVVVAYDSAGVEGVPSLEASGIVLKTTSVAATSVAARSAVITWQTNKVSDQQVVYGTSTNYGMSTSVDPALVMNHSQTLTGLLPETTYHYQARSRDEGGSVAQSADLTFTTPSELLLSTLSPSGGTTGTQVVINGKGFGAAQSAGKVTFSGVAAPVVAWGQSSITASVPVGATSGPVVVTVSNAKSNSLNFKVNGKLVPPGKVRVKG